MQETREQHKLYSGTLRRQALTLIPLGIALNLSLGALIHAIRLPIYLDSVGTIAITLLAGLRSGLLTGVLSFLIGGLFIDPVLPWFSGTQAAIALYTHFCARAGWFRSIARVIIVGIGLGVVAGVVSAPVIVLVFGGISGSGRDLITGFLLSSGRRILDSVVSSGLASEPLDKTLQCLLAVWLFRGMPSDLLSHFHGGSLEKNGFIGPV